VSTVGGRVWQAQPDTARDSRRVGRDRAVRPVVHASFESEAFRDAVAATGRKRLIIGGLHTEVCLAFGVIDASRPGTRRDLLSTPSVADPRSPTERGSMRMALAGAVPNNRSRGWSLSGSATGPGRSPTQLARPSFVWLARVAEVTDTVGVTEGEAAPRPSRGRRVDCPPARGKGLCHHGTGGSMGPRVGSRLRP